MSEEQLMHSILEARCHDPFAYLGRHEAAKGGVVVRAMLPRAVRAWVVPEKGRATPMKKIHDGGMFEARLARLGFDSLYRLRIENQEGHRWEVDDPYRFPPVLGDLDLHLIGEGNHFEKYSILGAHVREHEGVNGVDLAAEVYMVSTQVKVKNENRTVLVIGLDSTKIEDLGFANLIELDSGNFIAENSMQALAGSSFAETAFLYSSTILKLEFN